MQQKLQLLLKSVGTREKIILAVIFALIILIPSGSFVLSQALTPSPPSSDIGSYTPVTTPKEVPDDSPLSKLVKELQATPSPSPTSIINVTPTATDTATLLLGQTLSFRLVLEGRPFEKYATKVFLGLGQGNIQNSPSYLLSFLVNIPDSGIYTNLPLAGLDEGQTYTAYIKGPSQLATASAFVVKPTPIDLGNLNLITGDVNEDNVIDNLDYNIVKSALGLTPDSTNWNPVLDFNLDNRINTLDLTIVNRNLGKIGLSGPWYSSQQTATKSATVSGSPYSGSADNSPKTGKGYWMWMPDPESF
jgi:hypothetical protein